MTSSQPPSGYSSSKVGLSALLILVLVPIMTYFMRISNTLTYQYRPTPLPAVGRGMDMTQRVDVFSMEVSASRSNTSQTSDSKVDHSFFDTILSIPWDHAEEWDLNKQRKTAEDVMRNILPSLIAEPFVEINQSCKPEINYTTFTSTQTHELCKSSTSNVFTGEVNSQPIKIGVVIMLGFETDVVEIRMREMYDLVDKIFIGESANGHNMLMRKPLIWEYLATQKRFQPFLPKIVRFIVDESNGFSETWQKYQGTIWKSEGAQRTSLNKKLILWNEETKFFKDNDLVLVDHADDVIAARNLFKLRNCQIRPEVGVIAFNQWFPWSRLNTAYKGNQPTFEVLAAGGFNTWKHFIEAKSDKARRTDERHFIKGGMHMTDNPYAPFMFAKRYLACTECSMVFGPQGKDKRNVISSKIKEFRKTGDKQKFVTSIQQDLIAQPERHIKAKKLVDLKSVRDPNFHKEVYHVPWFLKCNLERYPGWVGKIDPRIGLR